MAYIYKIYNDFNDKIYIGKTSRSVELRFKEHFKGTSGSNSYIDAAMKKHGIEHFFYEILEECEILLTISEGKFHQVKRMLLAVGNEVLYLKRLSMGSLKLDENLKAGEYRALTGEEIEKLC